MDALVRPAVLADQAKIANLIHFSPFVHRHLDWRYPLDWLGESPFYVLEDKGSIIATLACPPDPPLIAWVRLFSNSGRLSNQEAWSLLWKPVQLDLSRRSRTIIAAIVLQDWLPDLLVSSGLTTNQSIVMLQRNEQPDVKVELPLGFSIRSMRASDLPVVAEVDAAAFDRLWQNSLPSLEHAYPQAVYPTVMEKDHQVVGYQISTRNAFGAHLARLAVRPELQGRGLGRAIVAELIQQTSRHGMPCLTVNTQSDNFTSLALYNNIGFRETGDRYDVYRLQFS